VPTLLRIRITDQLGGYLGGLHYKLEVGKVTKEEVVPATGLIECAISATERTGMLRLWKNKGPGIVGYSFPLELGPSSMNRSTVPARSA